MSVTFLYKLACKLHFISLSIILQLQSQLSNVYLWQKATVASFQLEKPDETNDGLVLHSLIFWHTNVAVGQIICLVIVQPTPLLELQAEYIAMNLYWIHNYVNLYSCNHSFTKRAHATLGSNRGVDRHSSYQYCVLLCANSVCNHRLRTLY